MGEYVSKGTCQECGRRFTLRADGTVRHHTDNRKPSNLPFSPRCEGVGKEPKPGTDRLETS